MLDDFRAKHKLGQDFNTIAQDWYIPLAEQIKLHHNDAEKTFYVGINGCQGSGKSTLSDFLAEYLRQNYNVRVIVLSLDDFYLSQAQRSTLALNIHPLFKTRGVPGTHNVELLKNVLEKLSDDGHQIAIPRFNKASDNPFSKDKWPLIDTPVDIVIFEGWCWGVPAQSEAALQTPCNDLERLQDPQGIWRNYVNHQLEKFYQPLYSLMNFWVMLKAPSFDSVYNWRLEQEQKLTAITPREQQSALMSASQIKDFIQYYQRLTEHSLAELPERCNWVYELDENRRILSLKQKEQA